MLLAHADSFVQEVRLLVLLCNVFFCLSLAQKPCQQAQQKKNFGKEKK